MMVNQPGAVSASLTWEKIKTRNFGVNMAWLNNRLTVDADIYTRETEGMLVKSKTLPSVFGTGEPNQNGASLKTNGWELSFKWSDHVNVGGSPLNYSARFILADSRAYITKYDNPTRLIGDRYIGEELGRSGALRRQGSSSRKTSCRSGQTRPR